MRADTPSRCRLWFWVLLAGVTLFRLTIIGRFDLSTDEAHYFLYARNLALGYFDHPPMVAFLGAATMWLGETPFLVRLGPVLCWTASVVLLRALALALYRDERVALGASMVLLCVPLLHLLAVALLPDATLNLFWCGALLTGWYAVQTGRWRYWALTGVLFGGAMLSKYHGVLLPACLFCFLLASPRHRHWLQTPKPYVAGLLGLLVFLPNILWNAQHDWVSYAFQLAHGAGRGFRVSKLLENIAGQLGASAFVLLGLLVASWAALLRKRPMRDADLYVVCTSLGVFAFFCAVGLKGKLLPHWTGVGWWTGSLALAVTVLHAVESADRRARRWRRWAIAGAAFGLFSVTLVYMAIFFPVMEPLYNAARTASSHLNRRVPAVQVMEPFRSKYDLANDLYGWDDVGRRVEAIRDSMPRPDNTFVFCHRFFSTSILAPHLEPGTVFTSLHHRMNQYQLWFDPEAHAGWDALYVYEDHFQQNPSRYAPLFEQLDTESTDFQVFRRGRLAHDIKVYRFHGFKGAFEDL